MQRSQAVTVALVALLVAAPAVGIAAAQDIEGHPEISVSVPDNEVQPGDETTLGITVINDGNVTTGSVQNAQLENRVTTARAVRVSIEDDHDAPITVHTNEQPIASLPDGSSAQTQFRISVDGDAEPGTYQLPVEVTYNYIADIDTGSSEYNRTQTTETIDASLVVEESPEFSVVGVDSNARVGATGTVGLTLRNTGSEAANNASVTLTSRNGDLTVGQAEAASRYVDGSWEPGEERTIDYRVSAAESASHQRYALSAQVAYENENGQSGQSDSLSLGITPDERQAFTVVSADNAVSVGGDGPVNVTIRNDGPIPVRDASVTISSESGDVVFGESASASQYVGSWDVNATRTVQVEATATQNAEERNYTLQATVDYEDREGDQGQSRALQFGMRPGPEIEFETSDVASDLRVGEEGTLTGTLTNAGGQRAENVVVVFDTDNQNISPREREYSVGTLAPGESSTFEFDVEISESADAGPRRFTFHTEYRDRDGDQRQGESFDVRQDVGQQRSVFDVSVSNATVERGAQSRLEVAVTNAGNETFTDISAQLFADDPITVDDEEAFVDRLEPGETTTIVFEISAGGGALTKAYPVEMDFQYDDEDGDTKLSDTYRRSVDVTEPEDDGGPPLLLIGVGVLVLLIAAAGYVRYGG